MLDELRARRPGFVEGALVRLSDGSEWSLPRRSPTCADPEYDAQLQAVFEAEDRAEVLRAELALTIFLLVRNYELPPRNLSRLLTFAPGDPALAVLQKAVHALVLESSLQLVGAQPGLAKGRAEIEDAPPRGNPLSRLSTS